LGVFGGLVLVFALLNPATTIHAGVSGLSQPSRTQSWMIPWDEVKEIVYLGSGDGARFVVSRIAAGGTISWPASELRLLAPPAGQQPITSAELAALVVQRSGMPVTIRTEA
jgi:hypothetical protein